MSTGNTEMSALDAMLAQYENNNKPRTPKFEAPKVYDLKNYFNTFIPKDVDSATKEIRILPSENGSPFAQLYGHKYQLEGEWKTFPCLQHENGEPCPFCEARELLLATGEASDKELAKKFSAKLMYVAKVIDRANEEDGVKFWRFNHDYRKEGVFDKIHGLVTGMKKDKNIADPERGRDLVLTINRNANKVPVISSIVPLDPDVISEDAAKQTAWLEDKRTWRDVYAIKSYDYLAIIVSNGVPVWDKELGKFVDKNKQKPEEDTTEAEATFGLETVKESLQEANDVETPSTDNVDDMPF